MKKEICCLREEMKKQGIDAYIVPTSDCHNSEYVSDYFKVREWLSGFTGSNGTLVVTQTEAKLWTDGRYFIQADKELTNTGIILMKMGEKGVPSIKEYLSDVLNSGDTLGFDGKVVNAAYVLDILRINHNINIKCDFDLCEYIWTSRPARPCSNAVVLGLEYVGESFNSKLLRVRSEMAKYNCPYLFLNKLDDIMWLFNIRGEDVSYNPVVLSYALISKDEVYLFIQNEALTEEMKIYARMNDITVLDYDYFYDFIENDFRKSKDFDSIDSVEPNLLADLNNINYYSYILLKAKTNIVNKMNPTSEFKAVKNDIELDNIKEYFIKDSVAVTKFLYWLDNQDKSTLSEKDCSDYLDNLRSEIEGFKGLSFGTISAYGSNAAMMHYEAGEDGGALLKNENFLLVDSGGQYIGATTDVTRTIVLGKLSDIQKRDFTLVCKGMLNLMNTWFIKGCTGRNLDIIAREPLWKLGMDYKCGTGHGVGCFLNVHEGPQSIRWRYIKDSIETELKPGMLITDEPGVYKENEYGIRTENTLVVVKKEQTNDGEFLGFESLTYVPIDIRAIDIKYLSKDDIDQLNRYQNKVIEMVSPYLDKDEKEWIKTYTFE